MTFRDDPRIDRLETLASRISRMYHAANTVHIRQIGNLKRIDKALIAEHKRAHQEVLEMLYILRNEPDDTPSTGYDDTPIVDVSPVEDQEGDHEA